MPELLPAAALASVQLEMALGVGSALVLGGVCESSSTCVLKAVTRASSATALVAARGLNGGESVCAVCASALAVCAAAFAGDALETAAPPRGAAPPRC